MLARMTRDKRKRLLQRNFPFDKWGKKTKHCEGDQTSALTVPKHSKAAWQGVQQCHLPAELALPAPEHLQGPLPPSPFQAPLYWHLHRRRQPEPSPPHKSLLACFGIPVFVGFAVMTVENGRGGGGSTINHLFKQHR